MLNGKKLFYIFKSFALGYLCHLSHLEQCHYRIAYDSRYYRNDVCYP